MWFKVDDRFNQHPKLMRVPARFRNDAAGLWVRVGCWSATNLTDGRIDETVPVMFDGSDSAVGRLVDAGLWVPDPAGGWLMHDWSAWNPTRAEVESKRESDRKRKRNPE